MAILGSVVLTPPDPKAGQEVLVDVLGPDGKPYNNGETAEIRINGLRGSSRWMRWPLPGRKRLFVTASLGSDDSIEQVIEFVQVGEAAGATFPYIDVQPLLENPSALKFTLVAPESDGSGVPRRNRTRVISVAKAVKVIEKVARIKTNPKLGSLIADLTYVWGFGDGHRPMMAGQTVTHDFRRALKPDREWQVFNVVATAGTRDGPTVIEAHHTVAVLNPYAVTKSRGVLNLHTSRKTPVSFRDGKFRAQFVVENPEPFDLLLTDRRIELFFDQPAENSHLFDPEPASKGVQVKAGARALIDIALSRDRVPLNAIGFAAHYRGTTRAHAVRASGYFDIPGRRKSKTVDAGIEEFLDTMVRDKLVHDPQSVGVAEVKTIIESGLAARPSLAKPDGASAVSLMLSGATREKKMMPMSGHQPPGQPMVGQECSPENLPDAFPDGFACQATTEVRWEEVPARFLNAKKGDIILSPGGNGFIGELLRQVTPAQNYSHSGIMTRNHDEITHSTASPERLMDKPQGGGDPTDGFEPYALKYLWPGVVVQSVANAVDGEWFTDPDAFKILNLPSPKYLVQAFNPDVAKGGAPGELIPALVVKPDPFNETEDVRSMLKRIADLAAAQEGKSHYRFFCYTDPTIGLPGEDVAPADAGWAAGTYPSVCSSFIWRCVRELHPAFEGNLEDNEKKVAKAGGPDGLYRYTAKERMVAGEWLYGFLVRMVEEQADAGGFVSEHGAVIEDVADNVANQILNTFASDFTATEAKDSDAWRNMLDSFAVSPSDILFWDRPTGDDVPGLYGHSEPLIYQPAHFEKVVVHKWVFVEQKGTVSGITLRQGKPEAGVRVEIGGKFAFTGSDGRFTLPDVLVGPYVLTAYKLDDDGLSLKASVPVTVVKDSKNEVKVDLELPSHLFREVIIDGIFRLTDDESFAAADEVDWRDCFAVLHLGPLKTHDEVTFEKVTDDSVWAALVVAVDMVPDGTVKVKLTARIREDEDPNGPIEDELTVPFDVPPGASRKWSGLQVVNEDSDVMTLQALRVTNNQDNF